MSALQIDQKTGELFAQGDVDEYPGKAVEPVTDSSRYNDFDINLTRLSSVASANADSTITTVLCRVLCILFHALFA